jgi:DNA-binding transcriptional regulator GbsR (MarR family)
MNFKITNMFNTKLKRRVKELERKLEYQKRWNDEMYNLTKRMCKRLDKVEAESK